MPIQTTNDDLVKREIDDLVAGENGHDWDKSVPSIDVRKYLFVKYVELYPLARFDFSFMDRHTHLLDLTPKYGMICKGCWDCCMRLKDIDYNE